MQYVTTHVFPIIGSDSGRIVGNLSLTGLRKGYPSYGPRHSNRRGMGNSTRLALLCEFMLVPCVICPLLSEYASDV